METEERREEEKEKSSDGDEGRDVESRRMKSRGGEDAGCTEGGDEGRDGGEGELEGDRGDEGQLGGEDGEEQGGGSSGGVGGEDGGEGCWPSVRAAWNNGRKSAVCAALCPDVVVGWELHNWADCTFKAPAASGTTGGFGWGAKGDLHQEP